jgi:HAD superfamily hydrolase (TIGR01484 family)
MIYFIALATDYDGTLAHNGVVDKATVDALRRVKETGRKLILITGRELPDLKSVFPELDLFDRVVAENGALLYAPASDEEHAIAAEPNAALVERLREARIEPLSVGRSIVATWHPNENVVLDAIRDLGLELQIIFNKGAVMVLPPNVNKASGLQAVLEDLRLSPLNVIGFGDAENDHAFLRICGCSVAMENAIPPLKNEADIITRADHGAGVAEVIERLIKDEAADVLAPLSRLRIVLGLDEQGREAALGPACGSVLIAGGSGGGKSTLASSLLECLAEKQFQLCIIDPEGDYSQFADAVVVGAQKAEPQLPEILDVLRKPAANVVVNLLGLDLSDRPRFFLKLLHELLNMRANTARPHWILIDEAHHMLPAARDETDALPRELPRSILVTVHPEEVSHKALELVEIILGVGDEAQDAIEHFCRALGEPCPSLPTAKLRPGQVLLFRRGGNEPVKVVAVRPTRLEHQRHIRKYAEGNLGEDKSFYFRGPSGALNLRAQNLMIFLQIAEGVDDATWLHHLRGHDYSTWIREAIKDDNLADEIAAIEQDGHADPADSKARVKDAVMRGYTAPAETQP